MKRKRLACLKNLFCCFHKKLAFVPTENKGRVLLYEESPVMRGLQAGRQEYNSSGREGRTKKKRHRKTSTYDENTTKGQYYLELFIRRTEGELMSTVLSGYLFFTYVD